MDKSMMPILVALLAVVAAGAALALHGGEDSENGEAPSGYPPGLDGPENEPISEVTLHFDTQSMYMELDAREIFWVGVSPNSPDIIDSIVWASTDDEVCLLRSAIENCGLFHAVGFGNCYVTASVGGKTAYCHVTVGESNAMPIDPDGPELSPVNPDAPADVPSVSGGSPAMEFYLELAPGGSRAIDVPSEYLSLLSMAQWSSSDPSVCTVTADSGAGTVTAVAHRAGECDLTASLGFYSAVCHVTVG